MTDKDLIPHLRQFQHNDCSGLLFGYDKDGVDRVVATLRAQLDRAEQAARDAAHGKFLIEKAFHYADVDLSTDLDGENVVIFRPRFSIPEPAGLSYEESEWTVDDIRTALDAAIAKEQANGKN